MLLIGIDDLHFKKALNYVILDHQKSSQVAPDCPSF